MEFECSSKDYIDPVTNKKCAVFRPYIKVYLVKRGIKAWPISCLLDSGTDITLLPSSLSYYFKIDLSKFSVKEIEAVGGKLVPAYELSYENHGISFSVPGLSPVYHKIIFCDTEQTPLLGRNFFEHFEINFKKGGKNFEINE